MTTKFGINVIRLQNGFVLSDEFTNIMCVVATYADKSDIVITYIAQTDVSELKLATFEDYIPFVGGTKDAHVKHRGKVRTRINYAIRSFHAGWSANEVAHAVEAGLS